MTMQHDFSDSDYCDALLNLFKPGNGARPPLLAGRDKEQTLLGSYLRTIKGKTGKRRELLSQVEHDIVLYGPRGNGKTVLLGQFEADCRTRTRGVHVVPLRPKLLKSPADMAGLLLHNDDKAMAALLEKARPDAVKLGIPGFASADWQTLSMAEKDQIRVRHLEGLLRVRCRGKPLVVTVDEAHTLDLDMGATLLNLSEALRKDGVRFLLVLSGTPNLRAHLTKMDATFWGRSKKLAIGRLDADATRDALVGPLQAKGIGFDPDALARAVDDSQAYPYFIQLWGKALCEVLVNTKQGKQITEAVVDAAFPVVEAAREDYYQDRHKELVKQKLLPAAGALASAFAGQSVVHEEILLQALSRELGLDEEAGQDCLEQLSDLGYIWCPSPNDDYEPGIPSLMTHVQQRLQIRAAVKARPRQAAIDDDARQDDEVRAEDRNDDGGDKPKRGQ